MSGKGLSSRAIIGEFFWRLEQDAGLSWANQISMQFTSDQEAETYPWLGQSPVMREWIGGREAKGFRENKISIENKHFEATMQVLVKELRRDKTGQILIRIQNLAERTNTHWASLLSTLIQNGASQVCYDGHYFFDTAHQEGKSGVQSNKITVTLSTLPIPSDERGIATDPSVRVMKSAIFKGIKQIIGIKDDVGEPMNELARSFLVMVPTDFMDVTSAAISNQVLSGAETNDLANNRNFNVTYVVNPRLTWSDKFVIFRNDGSVAPFIRQEETPVQMNAIAEGSEEEFKNKRHLYGVDAWRNVGYGYWQKACQVTLAD